MIVRNILIVFLVSGLWHGANWTFLAWGALHALLFLPLIINKQHRQYLEPVAKNNWKGVLQMLSTFLLVSLAWVFFRSDSIAEALAYYGRLIDPSIFSFNLPRLLPLLFWIFLLFIMEWQQRTALHGLSIQHWKKPQRWLTYAVLCCLIFYFGNFNQTAFIYFAF